ncbi:MAG: gamma carbonic anhydrase family protein [Moraxellaceae bacterium]|jgi:carbonic anhydrase/acetyltransferase-like protein (isoleucine patch superfamily)|nr:gamma carbonic anhydrase family protein [Moraxellaceae bacterium]
MAAIRSHKGIWPQLDQSVFVDSTAVIIGDVVIGKDSSVWPYAIVRGDMHRIRIGERVSVQDGSVLHITHASTYNPDGFPLVIGSDVTIGHQATLHGCTIHDRVLVGMKAMVMDGAVVESDVILGAGAVVPPGKVLASGFVYVGSPAKAQRPLTEKEKSYFTYTAANYARLKDIYRAEEEAARSGTANSAHLT